jgi:hypothetical protein
MGYKCFWWVTQSLAAITPPAIGVFVIWIANRQRMAAESQRTIGERKLNLDLFDKRFVVYLAARQLLNHIASNNNVSDDAYRDFRQAIIQADFLFPQELSDYLNKEVLGKAQEWRSNQRQMRRAVDNPHLNKLDSLEEQEKKLEQWTMDAERNLVDRFRSLLDFRHIK